MGKSANTGYVCIIVWGTKKLFIVNVTSKKIKLSITHYRQRKKYILYKDIHNSSYYVLSYLIMDIGFVASILNSLWSPKTVPHITKFKKKVLSKKWYKIELSLTKNTTTKKTLRKRCTYLTLWNYLFTKIEDNNLWRFC